MKTWPNHTVQCDANGLSLVRQQQLALQPSALCLVSANELKELSAALDCGALPRDFEAKLARLAEGDLIHRFLAQNSRLFAALLFAVRDGSFRGATRDDCERLLRVLAYVRKEDDAIPDYRIGGFVDDQQEMRTALTLLQPLLTSFKAWRLRNQVPAMWHHN